MTTVTIRYDESNKAIKKALELIRTLGAKITHKKEDPVHSSTSFYKHIDEAKEMVAEGDVKTYNSATELIAHVKSL